MKFVNYACPKKRPYRVVFFNGDILDVRGHKGCKIRVKTKKRVVFQRLQVGKGYFSRN